MNYALLPLEDRDITQRQGQMRPSLKGRSLRRRIILVVALGMVAMSVTLGVQSYLSIRESVQRSLQERLILAQMAGSHIEYILNQSMARLHNITFSPGVDLTDKDLEPEKAALRSAYLHSIFTDGTFLLDLGGKMLWMEPYRAGRVGSSMAYYPEVRKALALGKPLVSNAYAVEPSGKKVISILVPLRDDAGEIVGLAGGEIDPTRSSLREVVQTVKIGQTGYTEIVDAQGVVLSSTRLEHILNPSDHGNFLSNLMKEKKSTVGTCHSCHQSAEVERREKEVMAFAPLGTIPWGVTVRQSEKEALAPAHQIRRRFLAYGLLLMAMALALAWGTAQSVVKPINLLTLAARRIAQGNLGEAIPFLGEDEVGKLGQSFDAMRAKLKASMESIQEWTKELEKRVRERTAQLEESEEERSELLRKVISAQEDERKRMARELHDETSQELAALAMSLEAASVLNLEELKKKLEEMRALAVKALDGIHQLIFDLRPALLDDLGLQSAIRWYVENYLEPLGVNISLEMTNPDRRLPTEMETALFRVVQEAVNNVAKHAEAENVSIDVSLNDDSVAVTIEDDGKGFDVVEASSLRDKKKGLGLLGMKERVTLFGGVFKVESEPERGTRITVQIPLTGRDLNEQD